MSEKMRFPLLAVRALNDYRRVSPLTYLGLRYSLTAAAALNDRWAEEIAPDVLGRQVSSAYLASRQYKQIARNGDIEYRDVCFPCANEALAEAALLAACSAAGGPFEPTKDVFSYHLSSRTSVESSFKPYFKLFTARQRAIAKACRRWPNALVLYSDIERFYPSVKPNLALRAWGKACQLAKLGSGWRKVGEHLLEWQKSLKKGLLVGPMFSHVIGNLLLFDFDNAMRRHFPERYFRYVDDVAVVVPYEDKDSALQFLREQLRPLRLQLNPQKVFAVTTQEWLRSAPSEAIEYAGGNTPEDKLWMRFIDDLKCYLMARPAQYDQAVRIFRNEEFRISLPRYRTVIGDPRYAERFARRLGSPRFKSWIAGLTMRQLVQDAAGLRQAYWQEFEVCWAKCQNASGLARKWLHSRLRYLLGRLMVLSPKDALGHLARMLQGVPEFVEYQACFQALATRDVSELLQFSGRVCAAAGQALATTRRPVRCRPVRWSPAAIEGYVTLRLLGVHVLDDHPEWVSRDNRVRFAFGNFRADAWVRTKSGFFEELFALAGSTDLQRHSELLDAPSDPDERWVVFADELRGESS